MSKTLLGDKEERKLKDLEKELTDLKKQMLEKDKSLDKLQKLAKIK